MLSIYHLMHSFWPKVLSKGKEMIILLEEMSISLQIDEQPEWAIEQAINEII